MFLTYHTLLWYVNLFLKNIFYDSAARMYLIETTYTADKN